MSERLDDAICFAVRAHAGMTRKCSETPYILHPLEALSIAGTLTTDEEILAAVVLHDTVEDTPVTIEEIYTRFGTRVGELVGHETENKRPDQPAGDTWLVRKQETLRDLAQTGDKGVQILWLADKLANLRSIAQSQQTLGDALFDRFNVSDPAMHAWYYGAVADLLPALEGSAALAEYKSLIHTVFDRYKK